MTTLAWVATKKDDDTLVGMGDTLDEAAADSMRRHKENPEMGGGKVEYRPLHDKQMVDFAKSMLEGGGGKIVAFGKELRPVDEVKTARGPDREKSVREMIAPLALWAFQTRLEEIGAEVDEITFRLPRGKDIANDGFSRLAPLLRDMLWGKLRMRLSFDIDDENDEIRLVVGNGELRKWRQSKKKAA